jgi:hypothetical protein
LNTGIGTIVVAACLFMSSALPAGPSSAAGAGAPPAGAGAGSGVVVVNEVVAGAYVELRNNSRATMDISGFELRLCGPSVVVAELRLSLGQTLSPGEFYVVASSSFTGAPADQTYWDVLPGGGVLLLDPDHEWVDGVAVAAHSPCGEGTPAPACGQASTARDAVSADTGSNAADFTCRARSPGEPNAPVS